MITREGAYVSNFDDPILETNSVTINEDNIKISFFANGFNFIFGHLFFYVKNSNELINYLIIKGMKKGELINMKVLCKYYYIATKKYIKKDGIVFDLICRALSHKETISNGSQPLDSFCKGLSKKLDIRYEDKLLLKQYPNKKLTFLGNLDRQSQIKNNYYCNEKISIINNPKILVIDDVITTGISAIEISRAILTFKPQAIIYFIAISRTNKNWDANDIFYKVK